MSKLNEEQKENYIATLLPKLKTFARRRARELGLNFDEAYAVAQSGDGGTDGNGIGGMLEALQTYDKDPLNESAVFGWICTKANGDLLNYWDKVKRQRKRDGLLAEKVEAVLKRRAPHETLRRIPKMNTETKYVVPVIQSAGVNPADALSVNLADLALGELVVHTKKYDGPKTPEHARSFERVGRFGGRMSDGRVLVWFRDVPVYMSGIVDLRRYVGRGRELSRWGGRFASKKQIENQPAAQAA